MVEIHVNHVKNFVFFLSLTRKKKDRLYMPFCFCLPGFLIFVIIFVTWIALIFIAVPI